MLTPTQLHLERPTPQLKFLRVVSYYQEANKMTSNNLALVFAPNLLWEVKADGSHSMQDEATDSPLMAQLLTVLIDDYDILFGDVAAPSLCVCGTPLVPCIRAELTPGNRCASLGQFAQAAVPERGGGRRARPPAQDAPDRLL